MNNIVMLTGMVTTLGYLAVSRQGECVYGAKDYYAERGSGGERKRGRTLEKEVTGRGRTGGGRQRKE